jgi:hypothetical protein
MLDRLTSAGSNTPAQPMHLPAQLTHHLAGKTVAHSCRWSATKRARLAAQATFGAVVVRELTVGQAAAVFGVPRHLVSVELKKLGVTLRHYDGNGGNGGDDIRETASAPAWETLTPDQKSEFLAKNFDAIWRELEVRTA